MNQDGEILSQASVAFARSRREIFLELVGYNVKFLGVGRRVPLNSDIGPLAGIFGVDRQPFVQARLRIGADRIDGAFRSH